MSDMGWTRTDDEIPTWDLNADSSWWVQKLGLGAFAVYHDGQRVGEQHGTREGAMDAAEDGYAATLPVEIPAVRVGARSHRTQYHTLKLHAPDASNRGLVVIQNNYTGHSETYSMLPEDWALLRRAANQEGQH